ncbi:hypothetical protein Tco_0771872 [Tanacetum coccineum]|uniref:Retroviral polymerase SH3-like domain-containing protein n=1 Tax=Tanacetum coccineum TaxID=301880 RepID=A0ABQ4ZIX3_9ASTR
MTHPHPNRKFVPQAVLTWSGKINTAGASVNTVVRPINTASSKTTVNHSRLISNAYKKGYSQVTKLFNKYSANKNNIFNKKVNTVRVKETTARDRAVGNPQQKEYKEKGVIDSGCSRHVTGNKCYLTEYEDYDGGFVSLEMVKLLEKVKSAESSRKDNHLQWDHLGKFDGKADEGFFVGYSVVSKAMRVFNKRTRIVKETLNIRFLENCHLCEGNEPDEIFNVDSLTKSMNYVPVVAKNQTNDIAGTRDNIVAVNESRASGEEDEQDTRSEFERLLQQEKQTNSTNCFNTVGTPVSAVGPSFYYLRIISLLIAVEASNAFENHLFERFSHFKNAFSLPHVPNVFSIDDTGSFGNAYDDEDVGAEADLNNLETTMNVSPIPITRIEKDHPKDQIIGDLNLAIQTRRMTKISDEHAMMDVKSAFLYGTIEEETLSTYLIENGFRRGTIDKTLFIKKDKGDILFDAQEILDEFFTFFLGLQVKQKYDGIFISQDKYMADILKKFDFTTVKTASTPIKTNKLLLKDEEAKDVDRIFRYLNGQPKLGLWYPKDSSFDLEAFSDSDYAGASLDRKSTIGDETVYKEWEDRMERAATTASSLDAEQDSGSGPRCHVTILGDADAQTRIEAVFKQSNDPPLSRGYTLGSGEDSMKLL